ncbi:BREX-1 system adenine-specific DNA-methyltransferase PglX, partial [Acidobacteria bacterium AH-259-O06]|nr:BREX-1 system adenine-specific DNA-methyltransferase PglX [Acidobacteria bacterium AH-259-O06]
APTTVDLEALLAESPAKRKKWFEDAATRKLTDKVHKVIKAAASLEDLHAALHPVVDQHATPDLVPQGAMVLQPSEERRKQGSHYTPRELTNPIVRTTLEPILKRLRGEEDRPPTPEQILDLKVCDPAMGSGAFLVEACRQLGEALIEAWNADDQRPEIPPHEDEVIFARRLVAQRCLYGVDKNPVAVDLAKVSLWLVTLARDHALTFLDHVLRHGDSLVGLSRAQLNAFHWDPKKPVFEGLKVLEHLKKIAELRDRIRNADENVSDGELRDLWDEAQFELGKVRLFGDLVLAAFFEGSKPTEREQKWNEYASLVHNGEAESQRGRLEEWRHTEQPLVPFYWEIEFPEVFEGENPGFDAFVGNPPFAGRTTTATANVNGYMSWLQQLHAGSHGNADLVAHFYRRAFDLLCKGGAFGLIATNTIGQGDTRATGLRWICQHGSEIFTASKRVKWPGLAAVVVSVVHVMKGAFSGPKRLDDRDVETITAFLFHRGGHDDPTRLASNTGKSFQGCVVVGMGFTFDDTETKGVATPLTEMRRLIEKDPRNREVIFPYIGGEEINSSPTHAHHRFIINFGEMSEAECRRRWSDLMAIVEEKVRPEREASLAKSWSKDKEKRANNWWQFSRSAKELYAASAGLERVLVISRVSQYTAFTFLPTRQVFSERLAVFPFETEAAFCILQSRVHELWALFFGSTLEDRPMYAPSDCFETFPFPEDWQADLALESTGQAYYEFRADLMVRNDEGLTKTYNRFHDPDERDADIVKLRKLHSAMDHAVLDAYGWSDIPTDCEFLLDYEIDEEEWGNKKKPWRCRWPDEVRDEVLARLLELNALRAKEEARAGKTATKKHSRKKVAAEGGLFK